MKKKTKLLVFFFYIQRLRSSNQYGYNQIHHFDNLDVPGVFWFSAIFPLIFSEINNLIPLAIREILQIRPFDNLDAVCYFDEQDASKLF